MRLSGLYSLSLLALGCSDASLKTFNAAPTAKINSHAAGDDIQEETSSTLFGKVSDSNHSAEDLTVTWYINGEVACEAQPPEPDGYTLCETSLPTNAVRILLEVSDPDAASGNDSVTIEVSPSEPPEATLVNPFEGGRYVADEPIEFSGRALDAEDNFEQLVVALSSDVEGAIDVDSSLDADGQFSAYGTLSEGTHVITLTATDTSGKTGTDSEVITVDPPNEAPSIDAVVINPNPATAADPLICEYTGFTDPNGDDDESTFEWSINGDAAGSSDTLESGYLGGDTVMCTVTPNDGIVAGEPVSDSIVISSTPPTIENVQITPDEGLTITSTLTCTADTADIDDEPLTVSFAWTNAEAEIGMGSELTLRPDIAARGDTITCTATVTDGAPSSAEASDSVVVGNTAPEMLTVSLLPEMPYTNDTVTAAVTTTDADGDDVGLEYAWTVNGAPVSAAGADLDGTVHFEKHDEVSVEITPTDGTDSGAGLTAGPVVVQNSLPTAPDVVIAEADGLVCRVDLPSTDADGDTIEYIIDWDVDGSPFTATDTTTIADDTIADSALELDQVWTCTVTPNDGEDDGPSASASLTIEGCRDVLFFDGVDDQVRIPDVDGMETEMTVEAWVRLYEAPDDPVLLAATLCGAVYIEVDEIWLEHYPDCNGTVRRYHNSSRWGSGPEDGRGFAWAAWDGGWHHIAVTTNSAHDASLYVDGVHVETKALTYDTGVSGAPYTGAIAHEQWGWLNGYVAGVRMSSSERYTTDFTPAYPLGSDSDTVIVYDIHGDAPGSTLTDGSGSGHDGSITDATWTEGGPDCEDDVVSDDFDSDGIPDAEVCAPSMGSIPRLPLWESVTTYAMDSDPPSPGARWCDGGWGDQGVRSTYGRTAWRQESDWNSLWIPDPIDDHEELYAVDVDLYLPSGNRSGEFGINRAMGGACHYSAGGLVLGYSDDRCGSTGPCMNIGGSDHYYTGGRDDVFDRWVNMRFEVFQSDGLVQFWIDDELETCFFAEPDDLMGPEVKFNANTSCCSDGPNFAISNLNFDVGSL